MGNVLAIQQQTRLPEVAVQLGAHFRIIATGLEVIGDPSVTECEEVSPQLAQVERVGPFAVGDFVLYCERAFGEEQASQVIDHTVFSEQTVRSYRWVAEKVAPEVRRLDRLSFKHHMIVAKLTPSQQKHWLTRACGGPGEEPWSVARLQAAIRSGDDGAVTAYWLIVRCSDRRDMEAIKAQMEGQGRVCKVSERREKEPKKVTARAKNPGKKRGRSRG